MNFTYMYEDDPDHDELKGNITFNVPDFEMPAHWVHAEYICNFLLPFCFIPYFDDHIYF